MYLAQGSISQNDTVHMKSCTGKLTYLVTLLLLPCLDCKNAAKLFLSVFSKMLRAISLQFGHFYRGSISVCAVVFPGSKLYILRKVENMSWSFIALQVVPSPPIR